MSAAVYYHYTTVDGCVGILNSRSLWLSDYRFLNDRLELSQARADFIRLFEQPHQAALTRAFRWHDRISSYCVLSLSKSPRILSQWRAYAGDGSGMALGFDQDFLRSAGLTLLDCIYEDHQSYIFALADRSHDSLVDLLNVAEENWPDAQFNEWAARYATALDTINRELLVLKNPAFVEEQEVRAVRSVPAEAMTLRAARGLVIPYIATPIANSLEGKGSTNIHIREVWVGPKCNRLNAEALLMASHTFSQVLQYDCGYV